MRVYEAKLVYSLVSLGEEVVLDTPERVAAYLESAYAEYLIFPARLGLVAVNLPAADERFFAALQDRADNFLGFLSVDGPAVANHGEIA